MIRFRLRERMADMSFRLKERVTLESVAEATGIHRATLSKIASPQGTNTTTDSLDRLCRHFGCSLAELAEYVPDEAVSGGDTEGEGARPPSKEAAAVKPKP